MIRMSLNEEILALVEKYKALKKKTARLIKKAEGHSKLRLSQAENKVGEAIPLIEDAIDDGDFAEGNESPINS